MIQINEYAMRLYITVCTDQTASPAMTEVALCLSRQQGGAAFEAAEKRISDYFARYEQQNAAELPASAEQVQEQLHKQIASLLSDAGWTLESLKLSCPPEPLASQNAFTPSVHNPGKESGEIEHLLSRYLSSLLQNKMQRDHKRSRGKIWRAVIVFLLTLAGLSLLLYTQFAPEFNIFEFFRNLFNRLFN